MSAPKHGPPMAFAGGKRCGKTAMSFAEYIAMCAERGFISKETARAVVREFNMRMSGTPDYPIACGQTE